MSLSSNLKNSSEPACLRATGSGVEYIDKLPHNRTNCIKLCLSYNSISSLENITQFKRLNTLLIQYNLLSTFESLYPLKELRYLRILHLEGNPVCDLAMFDIHVISMLPNLQLLNGQKTKDILETKDLMYIDYEAELIEQIMHINFVYEVFKYVLDAYYRESLAPPDDKQRGNRNYSSSNTPSKSAKSALARSSSPASVSSRQNKSISSHPISNNNNPTYDLIKEAIKIKRAAMLENKSYKIELANSLRKNKFNDDGYISFLRLEVLRCDALIESTIIDLLKYTQPPSSPIRKYSVTSTPSKSPQSVSKDNSKQSVNENVSTVNDEIETFRSILSDLKGEEDFTEFVAQQNDLQALSFKMMGVIGGMDFEKLGTDASIGYNLTPTATPKKRARYSANRYRKYNVDIENYEEEEVDDSFNVAMTPSAELRDEKSGLAQKVPTRRAKTPAVSKKRNVSGIESSPEQKISVINSRTGTFATPQKDIKTGIGLKNSGSNDDEVDDDFIFENENQNKGGNCDNEMNGHEIRHPFEADDFINNDNKHNDKNLFEADSHISKDNKSNDKNPFEVENRDEIQDTYDEDEKINKNNKAKKTELTDDLNNESQPENQSKRQKQEQLRKQQEQERQKQLQLQQQQKEEQLRNQQEQERQRKLQLQQQKEQEEQERLRKQQEKEKQRQLKEQQLKQEQERQKQLQLQKQKEQEEQERQRQLQLQKQKEQEEQERLRKQQEKEKQRQLQLQKQKEQEEKERQKQLKLQQQKEQEEKERQRQLQLQKQKEQEEQERQRQLQLQKQKEQEEQERQRQLQLQKQKEQEEQERLRKQQEKEKQRQLQLQKQKEQEEKERQRQLQLQKQKEQEEQERQRQLKLQQQKEQEEKERQRQLQLQKQKELEEQERQRQLQLQKQKEQEEQERQRQLKLQQQKEQEEQERQRQLQLQKQKEKEEQENQRKLQLQKEQEEQQRQLQLQKQKDQKQRQQEEEENAEQLQHKRQQTPKQQKQQRHRPNESDSAIDIDLQEIVKSCDTLNINKSSSDILNEEEEEENEIINNYENVDNDQFAQEEEEKVEPIIPIDMNQTVSFDEEIFSSSDNENSIDKHENVVNSPKRNKKSGFDENKSNENISNDYQKEKDKERENSILSQSLDNINGRQSPASQEQFYPENEFEIEEEEEEITDDIKKSLKEQQAQVKKVDFSPLKEDSRSKASNRSRDKNSEQNDQNMNSYSPSSSAGNFVFQEPLLSTGEREEEEEEEEVSKRYSRKCSIVVNSNTPIIVAKETRGSSSECAEYLESGPDDEEESSNQNNRSKSPKHSSNKNQSQEESNRMQHRENDETKKITINQTPINQNSKYEFDEEEEDQEFEDHESNDLNNYIDNTATLSLDEKMQGSKYDDEEEEEQQLFSAAHKASEDKHRNQDNDNGFDYSIDENEDSNTNNQTMPQNSYSSPNNSKNIRDNFDNGKNDVYNFQLANASSDLRFGAFASSEKLNNSEENTDNYNYQNVNVPTKKGNSNIIPNDVNDSNEEAADNDDENISAANNNKNDIIDHDDSGILNADLSEDSDSFQRKMMNLIPQSIRKLTESQKQDQKYHDDSINYNKQPKRTILFNFEQAPTLNKNKKKGSKGNENENGNEIEIDADNLVNNEINDMVYDASRGESMSSNKEYNQKRRQKQKQQNGQQELDDFVDGTRFDAESGGLTTPLQSPEYPNSSFQNRFELEQEQDPDNSSFYQTKNRRQKHNQSHHKSRENISDPSKGQKRSHHNGRFNTIDNEDYYSYADESRDFHENENENENLYGYNYKRISDSNSNLANFGSNAFDASNGGLDTVNTESNEPHWLNSCDDTKFDASQGGAYDSAQPNKKPSSQQRAKQNKKQGLVFGTSNNNSISNFNNDYDFISRDQSTENESQHQVRFANAHSHRKQQPNAKQSTNFYYNKNQAYGTFSDSNSDLLNDEFEEDEDDDNDEASSSRAALSSSINPSMKNSNSYLNMTQDVASSSRPEPDSEYHMKSDSQYEIQRGRIKVIPAQEPLVRKCFSFWKSKTRAINNDQNSQVNYPTSTSTKATINESSYVSSSRKNSFNYSSQKTLYGVTTNNYSLKQISERRDLLRKIEKQKDINKALQARLDQIAKEIEVSENYSMNFEWPPSSRPSSPLASTISRERILFNQTQQYQQLQKQKKKKERTPNLFTQYRNHVMSTTVKKE